MEEDSNILDNVLEMALSSSLRLDLVVWKSVVGGFYFSP